MVEKSASILLALVLVNGVAHAQEYPAKPVRVVVPFSPGGSTDTLARITGQKLNERWGRAVVVENRAGAGGSVGAELVARSPADGYTLLMGGIPHAIGMTLHRKLAYDLTRDLTAVANVAGFPSVIVTHPSLPAANMRALIALAKSRPGEINYGSGGNGSPNHLTLELVNWLAKVKLVHIPYKGGGQVLPDLVAGQIQLASLGLPAAVPLIQGGKLRALAVTGSTRAAVLPQVPTVSEAALPGFEVNSWYGLFAPAGTPGDVVAKINRDVVAVLAGPDVKERLASMGAEPSSMGAEDFARYVRDEVARWAKVVKGAGLQVD